jgi:hypothetical protein
MFKNHPHYRINSHTLPNPNPIPPRPTKSKTRKQNLATKEARTKQQNVRMLHRQLGEHDTVPQPVGELIDRRGLVGA